MKSRNIIQIILFGATLWISSILAASGATFSLGDVFIGVGNGQIQWRRPDGTLVQVLNTGNGSAEVTGMAFDTADRLYATCFSVGTVVAFNPDGSLVGTFGSGYSGNPESVLFDSAGSVYIGSVGGDNNVREFNPAGVPLTQFDVATERRGSDWIDLAADQCTLYYTSEGRRILRYNVCTDTQLDDFVTTGSGLLTGSSAFALRIIPSSGQVLVADTADIRRISADGTTVLQTYDAPGENFWFALNLDPDGTSFWSAGYTTFNVYKFDIASGNVLLSFNTQSTGPSVAGLTVFGELTAGVPPNLVLSPALATNQVGSTHVVTLTATSNAVPVVGLTVDFVVSGANSATGSVVTDAAGHGQFSYTGTNPGVDVITANAMFGLVPKSAIARKIWLPSTGPNLSKYNLIQGTNISIGEVFSYEISFDTFSVDVAVVDLHVVDVLPLEVTFLAVTTNGAMSAVYDVTTHSVVWDFGTWPPHTAGPTNYVTVRANTNVIGGSTIINLASLTSSNLPPVTTRDRNPRCPTCPPGVVTASNSPPVVVCQSITVNPDPGASSATVTPEQVGAGSYDPEGAPLTLALTPPGPYPVGNNQVTLTVTDASGLSASCTSTIVVLGARSIKEAVLADLRALRDTLPCDDGDEDEDGDNDGDEDEDATHHDCKKLEEAIKHLTKSLAPELWIDETHLQRKHGEKVFHEEKEAAHKLLELIKEKKSVIPDAVLHGFIDRLVAADRLLAEVAIAEAEAAGVNPKKIAHARKELEKAEEELAKGHPDHAIEHFGHAWKDARHAKIQNLQPLPSGSVNLEILGFADESYVIQTSTNLNDWVDLGEHPAGQDGELIFKDTNPGSGPMRFYRILEP